MKGICTMALAAALAAGGCASPAAKEVFCYVGCNFGSKDLQGIHILACDPATGSAREVGKLDGVQGTTYFTFSDDRTKLYSMRADPVKPRGRNGVIVCYAIGPTNLVELNRVALDAGVPCYIARNRAGTALVWADYGNAIAGVCALAPDGTLDTSVKPVTVQHHGSGPNKERQESAHAHCAFLTPDERYLGIVDLGMDKIVFYDFTSWRTGLKEVPSLTTSTAPGLGPRHVCFSPDGKFMFLIHELGNSVSSYRYDGKSLWLVCTRSTLPEGFTDFSKSAAIKLTADGRILMASNRGHDSIAFFDVDPATGLLTRRNIAKLLGRYPRDFELMPGEKFMIVGHKLSDEIQIYAFDRKACTLTPVGKPLPAYHPLCFKFGADVPGRH